MGILSRAVRNISRRKMRALLVIVALGFSLAILVSIPAGVVANQQAASRITNNLGNTITQTEQALNETLNQITCYIASGFGGYGFSGGTSGAGSSSSHSGGYGGTGGNGGSGGYGGFGGFGGFGGGSVSGQFGGGAFAGGQQNPMNETLYSNINSTISGIAAVEPVLQFSEGKNETITFYDRSFTRLVPEYVIEGVPVTSNLVDNYPILPTDIVSGQTLQPGETDDVLLSENNSAYFGVGVGGTVNILGTNFNVVGVYSPTSVEDTEMLYMNMSDAQTLTNNTGYITSLTVFANSPSDVSSVSSKITALHPELTVSTNQAELSDLESRQSTSTNTLTDAQNSLTQSNQLAVEEIIIVVVATSLIVLFVMLYTVRERTKEIGTLKAIGFSNFTVMSQFMLEGVLLSAIAGVVGIAIGVYAAPKLTSLLAVTPTISRAVGFGGGAGTAAAIATSVTVTPELIGIGLGVAVLLGVVGSIYPAWRASKIKPAEAMKYE